MHFSVEALAGLPAGLTYLLFFIGTVLEGPIVSMVGGMLLKVDSISFLPAYLCLMAGDVVADCGWYLVGRRWAHPFTRKVGPYFSVSEDILKHMEGIFGRHPGKILFLSKITTGFGFAIPLLMTAGMIRISFRTFLLFDILGQLVWTLMLLSVGFFFGHLYLWIDQGLRTVAFIAFLITMFAALHGFSRYARAQLRKKNFHIDT